MVIIYHMKSLLGCWRHSKCLPHLPGEYCASDPSPDVVAEQMDVAIEICKDLMKVLIGGEENDEYSPVLSSITKVKF